MKSQPHDPIPRQHLIVMEVIKPPPYFHVDAPSSYIRPHDPTPPQHLAVVEVIIPPPFPMLTLTAVTPDPVTPLPQHHQVPAMIAPPVPHFNAPGSYIRLHDPTPQQHLVIVEVIIPPTPALVIVVIVGVVHSGTAPPLATPLTPLVIIKVILQDAGMTRTTAIAQASAVTETPAESTIGHVPHPLPHHRGGPAGCRNDKNSKYRTNCYRNSCRI